MADRIIQTIKTEARSPARSFFLSFFFIGLGQMYNGELAKGAALCLLRTMSVLALPAWVISHEQDSCVACFISFMLIALFLSLASPVEAAFRAKRVKELPVRKYNAVLYYSLFAVTQGFLAAASFLVLAFVFELGAVADHTSGPLLDKGDVILVRRYMPGEFSRGDLFIFNDGSIGRLIALQGDSFRYDGNIFYINGRSLPLGYVPDGAIMRFSKEREDVVSESEDGRKYPLRFKQSPGITLQAMDGVVPKGHVLAASDDRKEKDFARIRPVESVRGRVEGILFSSYTGKAGMDAYGGLR